MLKNKGFTLIELIITLGIITITLPAILMVLMTLNQTYAKTLHQAQQSSEANYVEWSIRDKVKKPAYTVQLGTSSARKNQLLISKTQNIYINNQLKLSDFNIKTNSNLKTVTYLANTKQITLNISINHAQ